MPVRVAINCEFAEASGSGAYELPAAYATAVFRAGGIPVMLPNAPDRSAAARLLDAVDAVIFSGSDDLHPRRWGERLHPRTKLLHREKEESDYRLAAEALDRDLPILGICGGCQLLNVARGGSLIQDIPSLSPTPVIHRSRKGRPRALHPVRIERGSLLHRILRMTRLETNSSHHQAVRAVGRGFRVTARAADGIIEGIEDPGMRFALGVQWHPERLPDRVAHRRLFEALVHAATLRSDTTE